MDVKISAKENMLNEFLDAAEATDIDFSIYPGSAIGFRAEEIQCSPLEAS